MGDMLPGSVFAGHRIEAVAGRGGMGVVYRARQLSLDRIVALKVIAPALMTDDAIRSRFLRESRVAASIDHPHVIPIYYTGEEGGVAYIAMRHVAGDDLRTLVRRRGALEPLRAARIIGQVAAALDAAHASGLVHRDVKPANVLLGQGDHAYLTDFGLTKHVLSETGATKPGHWVGTLDFVAPEQIRGERVDARADVYALGCVLFYALTGRPPFTPEGDEAKLWAHLTETPPDVTAVAPDVPSGFDGVIARALAKAPEQRFQSAGDLGRAAAAAASGRHETERDTIVATGAAAPIEVDTRTAGTMIAPPSPPPAPARRRPLLPAIAAVVAVLAAGGLAALAMRGGDDGGRQPASATTAAKRGLEVESLRLGGRPNIILGAGGHVWTGRFLSEKLDTFDPATGKHLPFPRPEIGVGLTGLAVAGRDLWAIASRARRLVHLDAGSGEVLGTPVPLPGAANAVAATKDAVYVAVTQPQLDPGDQVLEIDPDTGATRRTIDVRDGIRRLALMDGRLWLLASDDAQLIGIDLERPRDRVYVRLDTNTSGDLIVGAGYLWATLVDADQLARYDPETGRLANFPTGRAPSGVVIHKGVAWVANRASSTLTPIDIRSGRPRAEVRTPLNPYDIDVYGDALWVTCLANGQIARVTGLDD